ncbi:hypothetical protein G6L37_05210 [Agrobacterium rubi]|nr:hypothetical protein [Agrobacterium rubi]NTF24755.1 hypothetical protein [Agrobacterium rubi]
MDYVRDLTRDGSKADVRQRQAVVRNRLVGKPEIYASDHDYAVTFTVERRDITATASETKCMKVSALILSNESAGFGHSEFGLIGRPRVSDTFKCDDA